MSIANPQAANNAVAALTDKKAVTKRQKIQEATDAERTKREILESLEEHTVTVRVRGKPIEMHDLTGEEEDWIDDQIAGFSEMVDAEDPDELENEEYREYRDSREHIVELLSEKAVESAFNFGFWKKLKQETRYSVLRDIRQGGQEARDAGGFRSK